MYPIFISDRSYCKDSRSPTNIVTVVDVSTTVTMSCAFFFCMLPWQRVAISNGRKNRTPLTHHFVESRDLLQHQKTELQQRFCLPSLHTPLVLHKTHTIINSPCPSQHHCPLLSFLTPWPMVICPQSTCPAPPLSLFWAAHQQSSLTSLTWDH